MKMSQLMVLLCLLAGFRLAAASETDDEAVDVTEWDTFVASECAAIAPSRGRGPTAPEVNYAWALAGGCWLGGKLAENLAACARGPRCPSAWPVELAGLAVALNSDGAWRWNQLSWLMHRQAARLQPVHLRILQAQEIGERPDLSDDEMAILREVQAAQQNFQALSRIRDALPPR